MHIYLHGLESKPLKEKQEPWCASSKKKQNTCMLSFAHKYIKLNSAFCVGKFLP